MIKRKIKNVSNQLKVKGASFLGSLRSSMRLFKGEELRWAALVKGFIKGIRLPFDSRKIYSRFFSFGDLTDRFTPKKFWDINTFYLKWVRNRSKLYFASPLRSLFSMLFLNIPGSGYSALRMWAGWVYRWLSRAYSRSKLFFEPSGWSEFNPTLPKFELPRFSTYLHSFGYYYQSLADFFLERRYSGLRVLYKRYYTLRYRIKLLILVSSKGHYDRLQEIWQRLQFSGFYKGPTYGGTFLARADQFKMPVPMSDPAYETARATSYFSNVPFFMYFTTLKRAGNFKRRFTRLSDRRSWWQTRILLKRQIPSSTKNSFFKKLNFYKRRVFEAHYFYYNKQLKSLTSAAHFADFQDSLRFFAALDKRELATSYTGSKVITSFGNFNLLETDFSLLSTLSAIFVVSFRPKSTLFVLNSSVKTKPILFFSPLNFLQIFWLYQKATKIQTISHKQLLLNLAESTLGQKSSPYTFINNAYWFRNTESTSYGHDDLEFLTESGRQRRSDWAHDHFISRYASFYTTMHMGQYHFPFLSYADRIFNAGLADPLRVTLNISPIKIAFSDVEHADRRAFVSFVPNRVLAFSFAGFEGTFLLWKKPLMFADYTKNGSLVFRNVLGELVSLPSRLDWLDEYFYKRLQNSHNRTPVWDELIYGQLYDTSPQELNSMRSYALYRNEFLKIDTQLSRLDSPSMALHAGVGNSNDWAQNSPTYEAFIHQYVFNSAIGQDIFDDWEQKLLDYDVPLAYTPDPLHWEPQEEEEDNEDESMDEDLILPKYPAWMANSLDALYNFFNLYKLYDSSKPILVNENEALGREFIEAEDYSQRSYLGYDEDRFDWDPLLNSGSYVLEANLAWAGDFLKRTYSYVFYLPHLLVSYLPYLISATHLVPWFFTIAHAWTNRSLLSRPKTVCVFIASVLLSILAFFHSNVLLDFLRFANFAYAAYFLLFFLCAWVASFAIYRFIADRYVALWVLILELYIVVLALIFTSAVQWPFVFDSSHAFFFPLHNRGNFSIFFGVSSGYSKWYRWFWTDVDMMDTTWHGHHATNILFYSSHSKRYRFPFYYAAGLNSSSVGFQITQASHKPLLAACGYTDGSTRTSPVYQYFFIKTRYRILTDEDFIINFYAPSTALQNVSLLLPHKSYSLQVGADLERRIPFFRIYSYFYRKGRRMAHRFYLDEIYKFIVAAHDYRYDPAYRLFIRHRYKKFTLAGPRFSQKYNFDRLMHMQPLNDMLVHSKEGLEFTPFLLKHLGLGGYIEKGDGVRAGFARGWTSINRMHILRRRKAKRDAARVDSRLLSFKDQVFSNWAATYHGRNLIEPETRNMERLAVRIFGVNLAKSERSALTGTFITDFLWDECFVYNKPVFGQGIAKRDLAAPHYYDATSPFWQDQIGFFGNSRAAIRLLTFWTELKRILGFSNYRAPAAFRFPLRKFIQPSVNFGPSRNDSPFFNGWANEIALRSLNNAFGNEWFSQVRLLVTRRRSQRYFNYSMVHLSGRYCFSMKRSNTLASMLYYGVKDGSYWKIHRKYKPIFFIWTSYHYKKPLRFRFSIAPPNLTEFYIYRLHRHNINFTVAEKKPGWVKGYPYFYDYTKYHFDERKLVSPWGAFQAPFLDFTHRPPVRVGLENRLLRMRNADPFIASQLPLGSMAGYEEGLLVLIQRFQLNLGPLLPFVAATVQFLLDTVPDPVAVALDPDWSLASLIFNLF